MELYIAPTRESKIKNNNNNNQESNEEKKNLKGVLKKFIFSLTSIRYCRPKYIDNSILLKSCARMLSKYS